MKPEQNASVLRQAEQLPEVLTRLAKATPEKSVERAELVAHLEKLLEKFEAPPHAGRIRPKKSKSILDLAGMLTAPEGTHVSIEDMNPWREREPAPVSRPVVSPEQLEALRKVMDGIDDEHRRADAMAQGLDPDTGELMTPKATGGLAAALERGRVALAAWVSEGIVLSGEEFAAKRGVTPGALGAAVRRGALFSKEISGRRYYVATLLDVEPADAAAVCLTLTGLSNEEKAIFWLRQHGALGGKTVAEAIRAGHIDRAVNLAKAWSAERSV